MFERDAAEMPTPKLGYFLDDGTKVPGVTTVLSRFKESGGLIHWAWNEGMEGRDYRETRDAAANAGTIAHALVECDIRAKAFDPSGHQTEALEKAYMAFAAYLEWKEQTNLKPVASEVALISEKHRFGGTLDAMLVNGKLSLGDVKTSAGIYQEYLYQLAAYGIVWEENNPDRPIEGGYHLLRFSKQEGDFHHHYFGDLSEARRGFLLMLELYEIDKRLKARVR